MERMSQKLPALACAGLIASLVACQPQTPDNTVADTTPTTEAPVATPTTATPAPTAAAVADASDARAFAGRFAGGTASLELRGDGSFQFRDGGIAIDGTWTAEEAGTRIRLDPDSKAESDRLYAIASQDQLRPLDADGQPTSGIDLRREAIQ
jgi:hypothetical protein